MLLIAAIAGILVSTTLPANTELAATRANAGSARSEIVLLDTTGVSPSVLVASKQRPLPTQVAWSPDGRRFVYTAEPRAGKPDLFVATVGSTASRRLTTSGNAEAPSWSPDGGTIAFARFRDTGAGRSSAIWTVAASGGTPRRLSLDTPGMLQRPGDWSPDGTYLAFSQYPASTGDSGESGIWIVDAGGNAMRRLSEEASDPTWSPDGHSIAFVSARDGHGNELYVMRADGTRPRRLTSTRGVSERSPSWSTDGARIAFEASGVIATVNADGTCTRTIASDRSAKYASPRWSPRARPGRASC